MGGGRPEWDFDDPAGSERRFRAAMPAADAVERAVLATQVARALGLQDRFDEAHAVLDAVPSGLGPEVEVRTLLERGRLLRSAGAPDPEPFRAAARAARRAGLDGLAADALHMVALCATTPAQQVAAGQDALAFVRSSGAEEARRWEASILHNIGCAQVDAGHLSDALRTFTQAHELRQAAGQMAEERVARWMIAWVLRLLGRREEALERQLALAADLRAAGLEDPDVQAEIALLRQQAGS